MNSGYIAILDSGIGGFAVLAEAARLLKEERFLYFGDNKNAPYGSKTKGELYSLLRKNLDAVFKYNVKAVIVGCNTLSVSVLPLVAPTLKIPIFGVYPPVGESCGTTFLFATPVTCSYYKNENLTLFSLPDLAADIEKNKTDLSAVDIKRHLGSTAECAPDARPDTVILGCTHYFFVKNQFSDHFCPRKIISGERETAKALAKTIRDNGLIGKNKEFTVDFIGENSEENFKFYNSVVKDIIFGKEKN
ncbi:MAG: hypothetical protein VZQ61_00985 [Christensenellaceae bacterium]